MSDYTQMLASGRLDYIAITDHNQVSFALEAQKQLGSKIIVGEEVLSAAGEVVGLYLEKAIAPKQTIRRTVEAILDQNGLVYIPHPFELFRSGITYESLQSIADTVHMIEVWNGRALLHRHDKIARDWAAERANVVDVASSDAHGVIGWGRSYSAINQPPTRDTILTLLQKGQLVTRSIGFRGMLYPKLNRFRNKLSHVE